MAELDGMGNIERDLEALARELGGGWRIEHGVMPVVVLTSVEAERLRDRLAANRGAVERIRELEAEVERLRNKGFIPEDPDERRKFAADVLDRLGGR
jgi:hypothetical protein